MKTLQRMLVMLLWCLTLFASHARADTITYFHNDLLGSPAAATNESGTVIWREAYSGYGERIKNEANSAPNKVWYTSRHQDADTGLVYMGARYYDPALGRFLSVDSVGFNEQNVHSFNRYAYANNNPYRFRDPSGNSPEDFLPKDAPILSFGRTIGGLAAYGVGAATRNSVLMEIASEGLAESRQQNIELGLLLATMGRARTSKVEPIADADGPHTTWKNDPVSGEITRHETWAPNSRNPTGWDSVQSTDIKGAPHINKETGIAIPTPHTQSKDISGGVRPATQNEIPNQ